MVNSTIIRFASESDIPAITEIYNHYITNTTATFDLDPVSIENRREWFTHYSPDSRYKLIVAEFKGKVAGYASTSKFREKAAYRQSVESSIYIHPEFTGRGVGHALYSKLFSLLAETGVHRIYACITVPNPASIALHRKFGFVPVGVFTEAGYKFGEYRDIQWMEKHL